jgi:outer membrane protein assembly factor BamD (BamD/ComL family)
VAPKDDDEGFDLSHLEPDYTWKEFKNLIGWGPDEKIARQAYEEAKVSFANKDYDNSAKKFYEASWRWPDSQLEEDAMFLEAESYFFADRYGKAQDAYTLLLKQHENTRYMDTAVNRLFAIATFWEQVDMQAHHWPLTPNPTDKTQPIFDTYGNMLAAYRAVWLNDPTGPLADVSLMRVGNSHFRRGEWEDAAYHYGLIRKNHPKSKFQKEAHLLELQARMQLYQGPRYSASPLMEAQDIADQTLKQFRGQLGEDEARVRQTKAQIVEMRADRDWMMAQYYDSKAYYGAAKYYYRDILEHFGQTQTAQRTKQRMAEIQGLPDEPPKRFAWLTEMFDRDK